jgi:predicted NAD/FAD-binding protein
MKIAIIGTGISGLGISYLLNPYHDLTIFEKENYIGGHSRTINTNMAPVDTGFIVFNHKNYPHLTALFKHLNVKTEKSNMSFGVSIAHGKLEYGSNSLLNIFAQKKNLINIKFYQMLKDIIKFNQIAPQYLISPQNLTIEEYLQKFNFGAWFKNYYLLAMGASIWSCPKETMLKFPAKTFLQFFANHGLLTITKQPQWYTVSGGSQEYVKKLSNNFANKIKKNCKIIKLERNNTGIIITDQEKKIYKFDKVIFACHADQALKIIAKPSKKEQEILGSFKYQNNQVILHQDSSFMPQNRKAWSSWIYLNEGTENKLSLSYWMNNLQNIKTADPLLVTLNPHRKPKKETIINEHNFNHPIFDQNAINAQERICTIQGENNSYFVGAYQRYGFHEDGLLSAVNLAPLFKVRIPWKN